MLISRRLLEECLLPRRLACYSLAQAEGGGKEADPAVIKRYQKESIRCYSVLGAA